MTTASENGKPCFHVCIAEHPWVVNSKHKQYRIWWRCDTHGHWQANLV